MIRRKIGKPDKFTFYLTLPPETTTLPELVRIAGMRWTLEACFEEAKGEVGLDHYEVRSDGTATSPWRCSPMPISPSSAKQPPGAEGSAECIRDLLPLTVPAVRRLLWHLVWACPPYPPQILAWSTWRRRHQQRAKHCHWRRRIKVHEARL